MESSDSTVEIMDSDRQKPKLSPEDEMTSSYLEERSEIYRELVKVRTDVSDSCSFHDMAYKGRDTRANNPKAIDRMPSIPIMHKLGDEIDGASGGALSLPPSNARVLDLCMAPGGFTVSVLSHSPHAEVCAFTLPWDLGGLQTHLHENERVHVSYGDVTMLYQEFGVPDVPHDHCESAQFSDKLLWSDQRFDLVLCDGQKLRTHEPHMAEYRRQKEVVRLTVSQLILAMQRIEKGGTLIILLHNCAAFETIQILHVFDQIAEIQLFKSVVGHKKAAGFYLIAKNVQPEHPEAVTATSEWKKTWKDLTFPPSTSPNGQENTLPPQEASGEPNELETKVIGFLERFGDRVIELGEPIWQIQKEALANAKWRKRERRSAAVTAQGEADEASTAATTDTATAAAPSGAATDTTITASVEHDTKNGVNDGGDLEDDGDGAAVGVVADSSS